MNIKHYPLWALQKTKLLKFFNLQVESEYADKKYIIPIVNDVGIRNIYFNTESWMKNLIGKLLDQKKGIFIDVGANIGQTLMKLRSFSSVRYVGLEPNPECVVYLEKLIKINKLKDCTICPVGLSNKNGLVTLFSNFPASPFASVIEGFRDHDSWNLTQTHVVSVMRGDDLLSDLIPDEEIAVIKIDVEGGELEVIEGLEKTLQTYRPFIISEILPAHSLDEQTGVFRKERQDRLIEILRSNNYSIFRIKGGNKYEHVAQIEVGTKAKDSNYVLVPNEMENTFLNDR
jgi:FkbM family methyltransferase